MSAWRLSQIWKLTQLAIRLDLGFVPADRLYEILYICQSWLRHLVGGVIILRKGNDMCGGEDGNGRKELKVHRQSPLVGRHQPCDTRRHTRISAFRKLMRGRAPAAERWMPSRWLSVLSGMRQPATLSDFKTRSGRKCLSPYRGSYQCPFFPHQEYWVGTLEGS